MACLVNPPRAQVCILYNKQLEGLHPNSAPAMGLHLDDPLNKQGTFQMACRVRTTPHRHSAFLATINLLIHYSSTMITQRPNVWNADCNAGKLEHHLIFFSVIFTAVHTHQAAELG